MNDTDPLNEPATAKAAQDTLTAGLTNTVGNLLGNLAGIERPLDPMHRVRLFWCKQMIAGLLDADAHEKGEY